MSPTTKVQGAIHKLLTAADFAQSDWAPSAAGEAASWAPGLKAYIVFHVSPKSRRFYLSTSVDR